MTTDRIGLDDPRPPAVTIAIPCGRHTHPATTFSLIELILKGGSMVRDVISRNFMYIDAARNQLAWQVLEDPVSTHTLWLDDDMTWRADTIECLLAHKRPVVGGTYFEKNPPYECVAGHWGQLIPGKTIIPLKELAPGLSRVGYLGMGCTLIETRVLRNMRDFFKDQLWFRSEERGEDLHFFDRCRQMGVPVFRDDDLECDHLTEQQINRDHWKVARGIALAGH